MIRGAKNFYAYRAEFFAQLVYICLYSQLPNLHTPDFTYAPVLRTLNLIPDIINSLKFTTNFTYDSAGPEGYANLGVDCITSKFYVIKIL
jgi:hypothetical protein